MENCPVAGIHAHSQPLPVGQSTRESICEVQSCCCSCSPSASPRIWPCCPRCGPELGAIVRNVSTAGLIPAALGLPHQRLSVQVPQSSVAITATGEADLGVSQGVAGCRGRGRVLGQRTGGCQCCLDAQGLRKQVPNGQMLTSPSTFRVQPLGSN